MPVLPANILSIEHIDLFLLLADFSLETINRRGMSQSDLFPLLVNPLEVLFILLLEPLDSVVKFKFIFSLDDKDFVFELCDQIFEIFL